MAILLNAKDTVREQQMRLNALLNTKEELCSWLHIPHWDEEILKQLLVDLDKAIMREVNLLARK